MNDSVSLDERLKIGYPRPAGIPLAQCDHCDHVMSANDPRWLLCEECETAYCSVSCSAECEVRGCHDVPESNPRRVVVNEAGEWGCADGVFRSMGVCDSCDCVMLADDDRWLVCNECQCSYCSESCATEGMKITECPYEPRRTDE